MAYFELGKINLSILSFEKAISVEENAESLLALAACLNTKDINKAIILAKKALIQDPNYADYKYRKEQLWGEKLQSSTENFLNLNNLKMKYYGTN